MKGVDVTHIPMFTSSDGALDLQARVRDFREIDRAAWIHALGCNAEGVYVDFLAVHHLLEVAEVHEGVVTDLRIPMIELMLRVALDKVLEYVGAIRAQWGDNTLKEVIARETL